MVNQLAQTQISVGIGKNSHCPDMAYAMDISIEGIVSVDIPLEDFDGQPVGMHLCPSPFGALVSTVTGGLVRGFDYLGQYIEEDIAAAGTSTIAFAGLYTRPDDLTWVATIGLPYARLNGSQDGPNGTYTNASDTGDARGLFAPDDFDNPPISLRYRVNRSNLHGDPYADRFASEAFDTSTMTITGTVDNTGAVAIVIPSTGVAEVPCQITMPDGQIAFAVSGSTYNGQLSPLWMSKYGPTVADDAAALNNLITVDPLGNEYAPVYVELSGSVSAAASAPAPASTPAPAPAPASVSAPPATPWTSHAAADTWLDEYATAVLGFDSDTIDWASMTLAEKHAAAEQLYADM